MEGAEMNKTQQLTTGLPCTILHVVHCTKEPVRKKTTGQNLQFIPHEASPRANGRRVPGGSAFISDLKEAIGGLG